MAEVAPKKVAKPRAKKVPSTEQVKAGLNDQLADVNKELSDLKQEHSTVVGMKLENAMYLLEDAIKQAELEFGQLKQALEDIDKPQV